MSALGHKRTKRHVGAMSALPPKADIRGCGCNVRYGPKADNGNFLSWVFADPNTVAELAADH